jgi:hypothetical protein
MRRSWLLMAATAVVLLVLACAWIDGGREPLRQIAEPVPLPASAPGSVR